MRDIFTPNFQKTLRNMVGLSGKGANQLGDYDMCNTISDLEYVLIRAFVSGNALVTIGF